MREAAACGHHFDGERVKVQWDPLVPTNRTLPHRRPDLIVTDKRDRRILLVEIAVCHDAHVLERASEKRRKYQALATDLAATHRGWRVDVVPIVVGTLGSLKSVNEEVKKLGSLVTRPVEFIRNVQRSALLGSMMTIRRHLAQ